MVIEGCDERSSILEITLQECPFEFIPLRFQRFRILRDRHSNNLKNHANYTEGTDASFRCASPLSGNHANSVGNIDVSLRFTSGDAR